MWPDNIGSTTECTKHVSGRTTYSECTKHCGCIWPECPLYEALCATTQRFVHSVVLPSVPIQYPAFGRTPSQAVPIQYPAFGRSWYTLGMAYGQMQGTVLVHSVVLPSVRSAVWSNTVLGTVERTDTALGRLRTLGSATECTKHVSGRTTFGNSVALPSVPSTYLAGQHSGIR